MPDTKPIDVESDLTSSSSGTRPELRSHLDNKPLRQVAHNTPAPSQAQESLPALTRRRKKTTVTSSPGSEYWLP